MQNTSERSSGRASPESGDAPASPLEADSENKITLGDILGPLSKSIEAAQRLAQLEWERAKLALRTHRRRALRSVWEGIFIVTVTITAGVTLVRGITGGMTQLFGGSEWMGEVAAAVILLGATMACVSFNQARRDRRHFRATVAKLGGPERRNEPA